jgi:hypothetical protein
VEPITQFERLTLRGPIYWTDVYAPKPIRLHEVRGQSQGGHRGMKGLTMSRHTAMSSAGKWTVVALVVAAVGVAIQIASGAPYPKVPPAFFILLIPAALIGVGRWWWAPILAVFSGLFLTFGLFAAGEAGRLTNPKSFGDSFGLWTQMLAVLVAIVSGVLATRINLRRRSSVTHG